MSIVLNVRDGFGAAATDRIGNEDIVLNVSGMGEGISRAAPRFDTHGGI